MTKLTELVTTLLSSQLTLGTLRKTRRQQQRKRYQTKGLMSKTIAQCTCVINLGTFLCCPLQNNNVK